VVRCCVWSRNLLNEEALVNRGLLRARKKKVYERMVSMEH